MVWSFIVHWLFRPTGFPKAFLFQYLFLLRQSELARKLNLRIYSHIWASHGDYINTFASVDFLTSCLLSTIFTSTPRSSRLLFIAIRWHRWLRKSPILRRWVLRNSHWIHLLRCLHLIWLILVYVHELHPHFLFRYLASWLILQASSIGT